VTNQSGFLKCLTVSGLLALFGALGAETVLAQAEQPKAPQQSFGPRIQKAQKPAQRAQKRGPPPEIIATYDDWKIQCETIKFRRQQQQQPGGEAPAGEETSSTKSDNAATQQASTDKTSAEQGVETRRLCGMVQSVRSERHPQIGLTVYFSRTKQGDKTQTQMRVMAPIGVFLPTGVGLEIDGVALKSRVQFSNCLPQICLARAEATPETLEKLMKGSVANFFIWEAPGSGIPLKVSLKGFGKALEALDQL
jgi:invasion protein IalB